MDHLKNFFFLSTIAVSLFYGFMTIYSLFFAEFWYLWFAKSFSGVVWMFQPGLF